MASAAVRASAIICDASSMVSEPSCAMVWMDQVHHHLQAADQAGFLRGPRTLRRRDR
jgi:hypothetical protein